MSGMYYLSEFAISHVVQDFIARILDPLLQVPRATRRTHLAIVVADADSLPDDGFLLYSYFVNPTNLHAERDFEAFAYAKALLAARTGMSTLDVVTMRPDLIEADDFAHPGAVVNGRLIVSVSGLDALDDHAIATWLAVLLQKAMWKAYLEREQQGVYFVGEDPQLAGQLPPSLDLEELNALRTGAPAASTSRQA